MAEVVLIYDLPRICGQPFTVFLESAEAFQTFVRTNSGVFPTFTCHNASPTVDRFGNPEEFLHRYVPHDIDVEDGKLENALADVLNLRQWHQDHGIAFTAAFSGARGFHGYSVFRPELVQNNDALKAAYRVFQSAAISGAKLRYADRHLIGDVRRLMRVVGSRHQDTGLYCCEIPPALLDRADIAEIKAYATHPQTPPPGPEPTETFREAFARLGLKAEASSEVELTNKAVIPYRPTNVPGLVKLLLPRICIHNSLMGTNPPHMIRVEACSSLVRLGYDLQFLFKFFDDISEQAQWVDRKNKYVRDYHVGHLWRKGGYEPHSCRSIRDAGHCVGKECPIFARVWPEEA